MQKKKKKKKPDEERKNLMLKKCFVIGSIPKSTSPAMWHIELLLHSREDTGSILGGHA
jgi:hypothetical protein